MTNEERRFNWLRPLLRLDCHCSNLHPRAVDAERSNVALVELGSKGMKALPSESILCKESSIYQQLCSFLHTDTSEDVGWMVFEEWFTYTLGCSDCRGKSNGTTPRWTLHLPSSVDQPKMDHGHPRCREPAPQSTQHPQKSVQWKDLELCKFA